MAQRTAEIYRDGVLVATRDVEVPDEQIAADRQGDRIDAAIDALEQLAGGQGTLTAAQLTAAVRLQARALAAIARLVRGRLDDAP